MTIMIMVIMVVMILMRIMTIIMRIKHRVAKRENHPGADFYWSRPGVPAGSDLGDPAEDFWPSKVREDLVYVLISIIMV